MVRTSGETEVEELTAEAIDHLCENAGTVQNRVSSIPLSKRLEVIGSIGMVWKRKLEEGKVVNIRDKMVSRTGYSKALVDLEMQFVLSVLDPESIRRNLEASLPGGSASLDGFKLMADEEGYMSVPAGPVLIISSGNSIVPTLIPTVLSLVTGNLTFLKPSISNYEGVLEVLRCIEEVPPSEARDAIRDALVISYFSHDSRALDHALSEAKMGVINFWGGEPARTTVASKVVLNPNRPRFFANGPMTGVAIISASMAGPDTADGLAKNIVLYDQQLCSSPTSAVFIGDHGSAVAFSKLLSSRLDEIGSRHPMTLREGSMFVLQNARRMLQLKGAIVSGGRSEQNQWTVVVSKGRSMLEDMVSQFPGMNIYGRRRFIEIVSMPSYDEAIEWIIGLPSTKAYSGIDKVQTVGLAVPREDVIKVSTMAARAGVYRIIPISDMFMRSALEPYDGISLASLFLQTSYRRGKDLWKGSID